MESPEGALLQGATELGLHLESEVRQRLLTYLVLLKKWGSVYNLTALRDEMQMVTHHLLDSLAVIRPLRRHLASVGKTGDSFRLLDVGSGAGLPGVVIAACCPTVTVCCVDAVAKKVAFVQQVALELKLGNLRGKHARVERLAGTYDVITSRAFSSLLDFTSLSSHALSEKGVWMAMKGKQPDAELSELPNHVQVFHVEQLRVPALEARRCLVWMRNTSP